VQIDFAGQRAVVTVAADSYNREALLGALEKAGFGGKVVSDRGPK
jgi:hypothetical protein